MSLAVEPVDRLFDHFTLSHTGELLLRDATRTVGHQLPLDRARLGDLTIARGYYLLLDGGEVALRYPFGHDASHKGPVRPTPTRGLVLGHHHSDWWGVVNALRAAGEDDEGLRLLLGMTVAALGERSVLAPTWAERACVILRRQGRYADEVRLIRETCADVPGPHSGMLASRLASAQRLASRTANPAPRGPMG